MTPIVEKIAANRKKIQELQNGGDPASEKMLDDLKAKLKEGEIINQNGQVVRPQKYFDKNVTRAYEQMLLVEQYAAQKYRIEQRQQAKAKNEFNPMLMQMKN